MTKKALCLPYIPSIDTVVVLKYNSNGKARELSYRPKRVYLALKWLKNNNHLYKNIVLIFPEWNQYDIDELLYLDENIHNIQDSDNLDSNNTSNNENDNNRNNINNISNNISNNYHNNDEQNNSENNFLPLVDNSDKEILLFNETELVNHLEDLKERMGVNKEKNS